MLLDRLRFIPSVDRFCDRPAVKEITSSIYFKAGEALLTVAAVTLVVAAIAIAMFLIGPSMFYVAVGALHLAKWTALVAAGALIVGAAIWAGTKLYLLIKERVAQFFSPPVPE